MATKMMLVPVHKPKAKRDSPAQRCQQSRMKSAASKCKGEPNGKFQLCVREQMARTKNECKR